MMNLLARQEDLSVQLHQSSGGKTFHPSNCNEISNEAWQNPVRTLKFSPLEESTKMASEYTNFTRYSLEGHIKRHLLSTIIRLHGAQARP